MNLCYEIASRRYRKTHSGNKPDNRSPEEVRNDYWQWQFDSSEVYFAKFHDLYEQIQGKRVLDIGCGLGGRTCYLASKGPSEIVASDINHEEIDLALKLADEKLDPDVRKRIKFEKVEEKGNFNRKYGEGGKKDCINTSTSQEDLCNGLDNNESKDNNPVDLVNPVKKDIFSASSAPLRDKDDVSKNSGLFDIVLLVDSMEHVHDPAAMLNLAYECTKPGGMCYLSTVGWYNHMASHVSSIVPIPFATVFFSDKQILDALRRIVSQPWYVPSIWDTDPPIKRWEGVNDLSERPDEYLNKITVKQLRDVVGKSKFSKFDFNVQGFSGRLPLLKFFNFLTNVPVVQEMYHSGLFVRMQR